MTLDFPVDETRPDQGSFIVGTRDLRVDGEWRTPGQPFPEAWDLPRQRRRALIDERRIAFVWSDSPSSTDTKSRELALAVSLLSKRGCVDLLNALDKGGAASEVDAMSRDPARKRTAEALGVS